MRTRRDDGFTLVELLIVVVILGILGAIVVLSVGHATHHADRSGCQSEADSFGDSVAGFRAQHDNDLPGSSGDSADDIAAILYADNLTSVGDTKYGGETPGWTYNPVTGRVDPSGCPT